MKNNSEHKRMAGAERGAKKRLQRQWEKHLKHNLMLQLLLSLPWHLLQSLGLVQHQ